MEVNHLETENWKYSEDKIREYFGEVLELSSNQLTTACKLLSAKKRNWTITNLLDAERRESSFEPESTHWWLEWDGLFQFLENHFQIRFPRKGDFEDGFKRNENASYTKIVFLGINNEISSSELSKLVSTLISNDEIPKEYFVYSYEQIIEKEYQSLNPYSDSTKNLTYEILTKMPFESFLLGYAVLKSQYNKFGKILMMDVVDYKAIIRDMQTNEIIETYQDFKTMIDAGWVVD